MSEEKNIPQEEIPQEQPVNKEPANETISSAEPITESETQPSTLNIQPSTEEDMEVHHHSHESHGNPPAGRAGKNWKSYFWEFLMLFLAVFCGFLAEYLLEHKIEKDRGKELAKSLYEDLKNDSVVVTLKVQNRIKQENALLYLGDYFKDSSLTQVSKTFTLNFYYGLLFRSPAIFEPRTVVLEQLKNSGSLRYFKNVDLQRLISDLSVAIQNVNDRQALENSLRIEYLNPLIIQHHDYNFEMILRKRKQTDIFSVIKDYENSNEIIPFYFKAIEKFDKIRAINIMSFYSLSGMESTRTVHLKRYMDLNAELLKLLRNKYHLE